MPTNPPVPQGQVPTDFDWLIYADATFAGLAILIPFPFVDALLEAYFRRRMPRDIARRRGRTLSPAVLRRINRRGPGEGRLRGCLMLPLDLIIYVLRNLYRTLVYFLTVYDAGEKLSFYWHRAFLLDYMVGRGHLDNPHSAETAAAALHEVLRATETNPMHALAGELIESTRTHVRGLLRAIYRFIRRREQTAEFKRERQTLADRWDEFHDYLIELAGRYDEAYRAQEQQRQPAGPPATP